MDFLNQSLLQIRELFRSMTPGARLVTGLLLAVVVISVGWLFQGQVAGPDAYLMGGEPFSSSELPAMEAAFSQAKLTLYHIEGNRIKIPSGQQAAYMGALADAGALPPNFGSYLEKAMAADSPFLGAKDKAERMKIAKQNELGLILRSMQGIESASVIYDIKKDTGLKRNDIATASVNIKPAGSEPLDPERIPGIRNLVTAAIAGMKRENVTVTDLNGRTYAGGGMEGGGDPTDDPYYKLKMMYEREKRVQINDALSMIPGAIVQVSAELDNELTHSKETVRYDPKSVVAQSDSTNETEKSLGETPGGRVGLAAQRSAQGPGGGAAVAGGGSSGGRKTSNELEKIRERQQMLVSTDRDQVQIKGLTPKRVQVTVVIPSNYYAQVWKSQNPPVGDAKPKEPAADELLPIEQRIKKDVEGLVVPLLPKLPAGEDPYPQVTVTTLQSLPTPMIVGPSTTDNAVAWVGQYWSTLGMTGLAFFSLLMLRSMVKAVPSVDSSAVEARPTLALLPEDESTEPENEDAAPAAKLKRRMRKGPSLKDELIEMVNEDPDAAASILRSWISNSA
jgi:flagellar M-ring protein FliF